jgi:type I restriction enzyme, S subunit
MRKLGDVCDINPRLPRDHNLDDDSEVSFVPMAAVSEVSGTIMAATTRRYAEVKKGYTAFSDGDVLFAKITPCMENGKAALASSLAGGRGFGSTEFHVLRARESVLPEWIYYFVRREQFRREAKRNFTGTAGQQRVPASFLQATYLPVPPLDEQRRIVDLLARAEGIVHLRREAQQKAAELIPAIFIDMFGDPATNPKGWPLCQFGEVGSLDRGKSRHRPRDASVLYGGSYPFIQTGDVAISGGRIRSYTATYSEVGLAQSRLWCAGTLCITIAANIAKTGVLEFDACFPDSVVGFVPGDLVRVGFVQAWLGFLQPTLEANAPQAAQKNINLEILRALPIPVPPIELQEVFVERCEWTIGISRQQTAALMSAQAVFDSLLSKAFSEG